MTFEIGQIFEGEYPKDAHSWCVNRGGCYVKPIEPFDGETIRFQIVLIEEHPFFIGQIFIENYPPELAVWCNDRQDCYIAEIEPLENGMQRLQVVAIVTPPLPELEVYKEQRKVELNTLHEAAEKEAHILSSLGFEIDANDRANRDISGLLLTIEEGKTVKFCDYSNIMRDVTRADLETMQIEIVKNAQSLYSQKWLYRSQIDNSKSSTALSNLSFTFRYESFYKGE